MTKKRSVGSGSTLSSYRILLALGSLGGQAGVAFPISTALKMAASRVWKGSTTGVRQPSLRGGRFLYPSAGGAAIPRLAPTPWIGRHEEVADGLHSVQETITALMWQTKRRREKIGMGKAAFSLEGSLFFWVTGPWPSKALRNLDQLLHPAMPTKVAHLCPGICAKHRYHCVQTRYPARLVSPRADGPAVLGVFHLNQ